MYTHTDELIIYSKGNWTIAFKGFKLLEMNNKNKSPTTHDLQHIFAKVHIGSEPHGGIGTRLFFKRL